jgi:UDP-N-acetylglucosamine acyltransferase
MGIGGSKDKGTCRGVGMAKIHPTAIVSSMADLADDVEIGAYALIEEDVLLGPGTVIRPHAIIRRYTKMGSGNYIDSFATLGGEPQDLKFERKTVSFLEIGNENTFREGVTISRATGHGEKTVVGDHTLWMANSHAGHNSIISDHVILVNGSLVAGHATIERGAILPANGAVHQFCWVGENAMFQGGAFVSMHVPPFVVCAGGVNMVIGLNTVGLRRRADITPHDREEIKEAFRITYQSGLTLGDAINEMTGKQDWGKAAAHFRDFVRRVYEAEPPFKRGLSPQILRLSRRHKS